MGYNPSFNLNPEQIEIIEEALRAEKGRLATTSEKEWNERCEHRESAQKINELLGHLHNQKAWYIPDEPVPLG